MELKEGYEHTLDDLKYMIKDMNVDEVLDLFIELGADDEMLDFKTVYASGLKGTSSFSDDLDTLYYELTNATSENKKLVRRTSQMHGLNNANWDKNFLPQIYERQLKSLERIKKRLKNNE